MVLTSFRRYGVILTAVLYTSILLALHAAGWFPAPGLYDVSRLAGAPALVFEGSVMSFPQTRWGQTRFVIEGKTHPLEAFHGRLLVNLNFPVTDLAPGEEVRVRGWLSETRSPTRSRPFDERRYWAGSLVYAQLKVWSSAGLQRLDGQTHARWEQRAWELHRRFKNYWFDRLPVKEAALLSCMTMGTRGILPADLKTQCIRAGVYHILVVSGQNMALIIAFGVGCLRLFRIPRRRAVWLCFLPILFYTSAVGGDPPVLRAAAMAIVTLIVLATGRDVPTYIPFCLAWMWILARQPEALFGASFQLSFGATASLLAFLPLLKVNGIENPALRWMLNAGSLSIAVHLGVWPILVYYFQQISLVGLIANWTIFPLAGGLMIAGLAIGFWGLVLPASQPEWVIQGVHYALQVTLFVIQQMSRWTWAAIPVPPPPGWIYGVYYALVICILWRRRKNHKHVQNSTFL